MSIHADDEFSLRIALESELDDVLPRDDLAGLVIARHRKIRRRRVAGAASLAIVCAGIGVPLGLCGPGGGPAQHNPAQHNPAQHNPAQRPDQHTGSVTLIPHARAGAALAGAVSLVVVCTGAALVIELPAPGPHRSVRPAEVPCTGRSVDLQAA